MIPSVKRIKSRWGLIAKYFSYVYLTFLSSNTFIKNSFSPSQSLLISIWVSLACFVLSVLYVRSLVGKSKQWAESCFWASFDSIRKIAFTRTRIVRIWIRRRVTSQTPYFTMQILLKTPNFYLKTNVYSQSRCETDATCTCRLLLLPDCK